jgi:hypothetical protein
VQPSPAGPPLSPRSRHDLHAHSQNRAPGLPAHCERSVMPNSERCRYAYLCGCSRVHSAPDVGRRSRPAGGSASSCTIQARPNADSARWTGVRVSRVSARRLPGSAHAAVSGLTRLGAGRIRQRRLRSRRERLQLSQILPTTLPVGIRRCHGHRLEGGVTARHTDRRGREPFTEFALVS